jgi:soluble lytic murein transglycosylase-like protein
MKCIPSVPRNHPVCPVRSALSTRRRISLYFFFLLAPVLQVRAGEITALRDAQGSCVYVSSNDTELRDSVKSGGVAAALRVIDQRKRALPEIDQFIEQASLEQRLDPRLVRAIIQVESAWNVRARSRKGALGLMQLMPDTALRFGVHDPFNARENISGGTRYLRFLLDRFHENLKYTLAAYNAGEKAVVTWGDVPPYEETRTYLGRIGMIYEVERQEADLSASAISRIVQGHRVVYSNLD